MAANALALGDHAEAAARAAEAAVLLRDEPDLWFLSRALDTLAAACTLPRAHAAPTPAALDAADAARLTGAADALRRRSGTTILPIDRARHEATVAAVQRALGPAAFAAAWADGAALPLDALLALVDAVADAMTPGAAPVAAPRVAPASPRAGDGPPSAGADGGASTVQVVAFGPLAVTRDGTPVPPNELTPAKMRELLLYLALHPGGRTKEQIALALWPDASPAQLRNAFHVTVHQLRRALGRKDAVAFDAGLYALARAAREAAAAADAGAPPGAVAVHCDVDAVLAAAEAVRAADRAAERGGARGAEAVAAVGGDEDALARWRQALDGARRGALGEGEDAGEWLGAPRAHVGAAWADGMEALARLHARQGAPREAAAVLEALVAAEPLREGAHRALMATYVATGEPARALAHYDALAAHLAREVGAAPGRETAALAAAIRQGRGPAAAS
jgi:DNA-binding SARP family transcriptional activator